MVLGLRDAAGRIPHTNLCRTTPEDLGRPNAGPKIARRSLNINYLVDQGFPSPHLGNKSRNYCFQAKRPQGVHQRIHYASIGRLSLIIYIVLGPALRSFGPIQSLEATSTLLCFAVSWGVRGPGRVGSGLGRVRIGSCRGRVGSRTVGSVGLRLLLLGPIQDGGN